MHSFTKTSSAVITIFLLFFALQQSFAQAKLVQTFIEQDISGANNYFGYSVSGAGDVNNDGYDDVIIGAANYNNYTGRTYIYYGGDPMNNTADVIVTGDHTAYKFATSVSSAGDVNNDGYDDVIVGAPDYEYRGRAFIYYGGNPMDSIADVSMWGEHQSDYFGHSVSTAGDVNGDGFSDVVIGADGYDYSTYTNGGCIYIYYGGDPMNNIVDVKRDNDGEEDHFGYSVSCAGDVNNDGYDDVVACTNNLSTGNIFVYYGGNPMDNIFDVYIHNADYGYSISGAGDVNNDGYDDVIVGLHSYNSYTGSTHIYYGGDPMDSTADVIINGEEAGGFYGHSVSGAGDINNDGYDDVIVGAPYYNSYTGRAYIYYGGSSMDSTADLTMTGEGTDYRFGYSVSGAGDVNNDGYDDFIVGAYMYPVNGKAYIYSDPSSPVSVKTVMSLNPDKLELLQNYPNPFNPSTTIEFRLEKDGPVKLRIFDILGREVATLVNGEMKAGILHQIQFDASQLASGIYFASIESGSQKKSIKLVLLK